MIYRLTRQADRNLGEIYLYTAEQFGIRHADQYASDLERLFELIAAHPSMGRPADKVRPGLRRHEHAGHVVFHRQIDDGVLIVAVIHRRMRPDLDPDEQSSGMRSFSTTRFESGFAGVELV